MDDFKVEMYVLPFLLVIVLVHVWGTKKNRSKARTWAKAHVPVLQHEFAQVGYLRPQISPEDDALVTQKALDDAANPDNLLREKKADEYQTYASGRQNVAFVDFKLSLQKRFNPFMLLGEHLVPLFLESFPAPVERMEATAYVFDGQEAKVAPSYAKGDAKKVPNSAFDGFVFAVVHKDMMKRLREERYDLSLTTTRDHAKLPVWTTVMSESAEVTDTLLTPELIKAIHDAGDSFEALVVSDQPMDQPKTYVPHPHLSINLPLTHMSQPRRNQAPQTPKPFPQALLRLHLVASAIHILPPHA